MALKTRLLPVITKNALETEHIACEMAKKVPPCVILLYGQLGAGKTTFVRGFARGLGIKKRIASPTFTYNRVYQGRMKLYHFDVYRLKEVDQSILAELQQCLDAKDGIVIIEWPEIIEKQLPAFRIEVHFEYKNQNERVLTIYDRS